MRRSGYAKPQIPVTDLRWGSGLQFTPVPAIPYSPDLICSILLYLPILARALPSQISHNHWADTMACLNNQGLCVPWVFISESLPLGSQPRRVPLKSCFTSRWDICAYLWQQKLEPWKNLEGSGF